jgi:formamidopyrimidine-DNA glycosylase
VPELPEVETIVRDLQRMVPGAEVTGAIVMRPDLIESGPGSLEETLPGVTISSVSRRAKNIVFALENARADADRLIINLGMTGRVLVLPAAEDDPPYTGVVIALKDRRKIVYQDVRRFGRLEVLSRAEWDACSEALGYEPLSEEFTAKALYELAKKSRVAVKTWLMDQKRVVGVGNIYASEAMFRAKIDPRKPAEKITKPEAKRLQKAIQNVLLEAINFRGTTLMDYRDAAGERGEFSRRLRVYDREGDPCVTCGKPIQRLVQGGRSTFFCPTCQK